MDRIQGISTPDHRVRQHIAFPCKVGSLTLRGKRCPGQRPNPATADEPQQSREPTASTEAKQILYSIKESLNAYPPLKLVAEDLWFILDSCEVWPPSPIFDTQCLPSF